MNCSGTPFITNRAAEEWIAAWHGLCDVRRVELDIGVRLWGSCFQVGGVIDIAFRIQNGVAEVGIIKEICAVEAARHQGASHVGCGAVVAEGEAPATRLSSPKSEPELRKQLAFAAQRELRPPFFNGLVESKT